MIEKMIKEAAEIPGGCYVAMFTDEFRAGDNSELESVAVAKVDKLLELRVFNSDMEYKVYRSDIGREFMTRVLRDADDDRDTFDEVQMLDIDVPASLKESDGYVRATGGGRYHVPITKIDDAKVKMPDVP